MLTLLAALPLAAGQSHEHEEGDGLAAVLHDGPDDGRAVVGAFTHFGFALLKDGVPQVHRNAEFQVLHNGHVLFATTDAHEYDGTFSLDIVFPSEGAYEVMAMSDGMNVGTFSGVVVAPVNETVASVQFDAAPAMPQSRAIMGTISIVDAEGAIIPHTDAIIEVRDAAPPHALVSRAHAHIHEEPIEFVQTLPKPGDYELTVWAYKAFQTGRSVDVRPVLATFPVTAGPLADGVQTPPVSSLPDATPLSPAGESATDGAGFALHGGYDPQALVGVGHPTRLSAVLVDANGTPVPHVDFSFALAGPDGVVFSSNSLHEYDGAFEHVFTPSLPGFYEATLVASRGEVELTIGYVVEAAPPVAPLDPGAFEVSMSGLDGVPAGQPVDVTFTIAGATGPLPHSEVDVTVYQVDAAGVPIYQFKLHTHDSGDTMATLSFPSAGEWLIAVDPIPLMPQASLVEPVVFAVQVAEGLLPEPVLPLGDEETMNAVPGIGALAVVAAMALTGRVFGRRE